MHFGWSVKWNLKEEDDSYIVFFFSSKEFYGGRVKGRVSMLFVVKEEFEDELL